MNIGHGSWDKYIECCEKQPKFYDARISAALSYFYFKRALVIHVSRYAGFARSYPTP